MYSSILVPVDLAHIDALDKALGTAAELARLWGAKLTAVGVTQTGPTPIARSPAEFSKALDQAMGAEADKRGVSIGTLTIESHDPTADLSDKLIEAAGRAGADLVVIGSHRPGTAEHLFASHGGYVASHAPVSVMVVR